MPFNITGMKVLVTASTRGIGRGVAEVLLEEGAHVVINGRTRESVEKALEALRGKGRVYGIAADLSVREDVERLVKEAARLMGGLDAVVYIAGPPRPGKFEQLGLEDWELAARLLALSAVWIAYYSLPYLKESKNPSMVYLTSVATREPLEDLALSNTMRIAVHGLVRTLARELGKYGIRVNAVMPGYILTDRIRQIAEKRAKERGVPVEQIYQEMASTIPLGRIGEPREVGYLIAFLISPYASYINGASIPIDGGYLRSVF
ncbi:SDR family oxidoreductase [Hyperthermus butylicus]|uniref:Short chain dehydrogenase n=1 Tax=Hyperthermus butylicus (strain DSM 5456 / JCM 9403 / PLM1-5) TaxID=415426 RepID=A2BN81_HYPBU|nr:SDR family oxidoreductase [Hyperthermus butylicus]ABM81442.1 short chain dehydrogenase [Hyperthermus butylicus DSM 5456]